MEKELADVFFPIHLWLDASLQHDADYPDLMLWLVSKIAEQLGKAGVPFDDAETNKIAAWFNDITKLDTTAKTATSTLETEAEASANFSWFGTGLKLLARIRSGFVGSSDHRTFVRTEVKKRSEELIQSVNNFLGKVVEALKAAGKPSRLLIVQDNLDRLSRSAATHLFGDSADLLKKLNGTFVWTPPVGSQLAPINIELQFNTFVMPSISVRKKTGTPNKIAIEGLTALVEKRLVTALTFAKPALVRDLILLSGGSIRDLIKLIERARLNARVDGHTVIEASDVKAAAQQLAVGLENSLFPSSVFFPILTRVALSKTVAAPADEQLTSVEVETRREFFHTLIVSGAIMAYNGEGNWFDVHPTLHHLTDFAKALKSAKTLAP